MRDGPRLLTVPDYEPAPGLLPIGPALEQLLILHPGEKVAFREDHPEWGSGAQLDEASGEMVPRELGEGETPRHAQYGYVKAIGFDAESGEVRFDVLVHDPNEGVPEEHDEANIRRIGMEDIQ